MNKFRRTGRTTKMLDKAIVSVRNGFYVYVIAPNHLQLNYFNYYFGKRGINNINVLTCSYNDHLIDWYRFVLRGATSKNHKVFFDHTIIESRFPEISEDYNFLMSVIDN